MTRGGCGNDDFPLTPLGCRTGIGLMVFTKGLYIFEASSHESGFDYFCPYFLAIHRLFDPFPFVNLCAVHLVSCTVAFHVSEALHVMPPLDLLQFSLVHIRCVLLDAAFRTPLVLLDAVF